MVELVFAMAIMMVVLIMGLKATGSMLNVETQAIGKGQATTQVVAAMSELRQEIVSANVLFDPSAEHDSSNNNFAGSNPDGSKIPVGWSMRIYTQINGTPMCAQWRILNTGVLQTRTWSDLWQSNGIIHSWATLSTSVVNSSGSGSIPFVLDAGQNYGGSASSRLMDIDLLVSTNDSRVVPVALQSSIAARNAEYYPPNTGDCYPVPTP
ncbi:MAG TPA: hypothetical protein VMV14_01325 [Acidimicrobiales bacterium]|nr:hypothetical protein [Acidimicrobiales bacterium]